MATAKLNDAKSLEEVVAWLKPKERMALLNDRALIAMLVRLPSSASQTAAKRKTSPRR